MRWSLPVLASSLGVLLCCGLAAQPGADPATTELLEPQPRAVHPGETTAAPPSDAIILFAGDNLDQWQPVSPDKPLWRVGDGVVTVVPGAANLRTRESFADVQLHLEWRSPGLAEHQRDLDTPLAGRIREQVESRYGMHQFLA
ncbi:MAG: family 16 glycoside hydrolase, partial [Pseudomonadales bacterium]